MPGEHTNESFVARLWFEPENNGDPILRGHIRHIQSEEEVYFQGLKEMGEFMSRISGVSGVVLSGLAPHQETGTKAGLVITMKTKPEH